MTRELKPRRAERPFVYINVAVSADGKIATANRAVHSFGSARDRRQLYELRATADAVMSGARTVEISEATLGNGGEKFRRQRLRSGRSEYPLRIVVSGSGSIDSQAKIFQRHFSPIVLLTTKRAARTELGRLRKLAQEVKVFGAGAIDFLAALQWLREQWNVRRLLCEGGGELNDALFRAGLVDEIHMTFCPKVFGGRQAPTLADGSGRLRLADAARFELTSIRREKDELFTVFSRRDKNPC
ncbi:MAG: dihydrofolate reductase family protein [Verrucomicrobiota bacterium]|jgi:riboflavin-specific deaminase-like protein